MKKIEEFLQHAADCRAMAQSAPQQRDQLEEMAKTWEQLAEAPRRALSKRLIGSKLLDRLWPERPRAKR